MAIAHRLDSDVPVYAFSKAPRDAAKARVAREWIRREDWGASVQILQEFYVNAVRKPNGLSHEDALAMVEEIAGSRQVISIRPKAAARARPETVKCIRRRMRRRDGLHQRGRNRPAGDGGVDGGRPARGVRAGAFDKVSLKCRYQLSLALMYSLVDRLTLADERIVGAG